MILDMLQFVISPTNDGTILMLTSMIFDTKERVYRIQSSLKSVLHLYQSSPARKRLRSSLVCSRHITVVFCGFQKPWRCHGGTQNSRTPVLDVIHPSSLRLDCSSKTDEDARFN